MKLLVGLFLAVVLHLSHADEPKSQYIEPNSVQCTEKGINFELSDDPKKSDIAQDTDLKITIWTTKNNAEGKPEMVQVTDYETEKKPVAITYKAYTIKVDTLYGGNRVPILYSIRQPFEARPTEEDAKKKRPIYRFTVNCAIEATVADIGKDTGTGDNGGGNDEGGTIDPRKSVASALKIENGGSVAVVGEPLQFTVGLTDTVFSSLMPVKCEYYDANDRANGVTFGIVSNGCPIQRSESDNKYFGVMKKETDGRSYTLDFTAFTLNTKENSMLGISCDLLLCFNENNEPCKRTCWGDTLAPPPPGGGGFQVKSGNARTARAIKASFTVNLAADPKVPDQVTQTQVFNVVKDASMLPKPMEICTDQSLLTALYAVIGVLAVLLLILVVSLVYLLYVARRHNNTQDYPRPPNYYPHHVNGDKPN